MTFFKPPVVSEKSAEQTIADASSGPDQISSAKQEFKPVIYSSQYPFLKVNIEIGGTNKEIQFQHGAYTAYTEEEFKAIEVVRNLSPQNMGMIQKVDLGVAEDIVKRHMANVQSNTIGRTLTAGLMSEVMKPVADMKQEGEASAMNVNLTKPASQP